MERPWCENIKVVQDSLAIWPSNGFTALIIFGSLGLLICYSSLRYSSSKKGVWLGAFMIFTSIWYFQEINVERNKASETFRSDRKAEFYGAASDFEVELVRLGGWRIIGPKNVDEIGLFQRLSSSRHIIWFKVGDQRVRSKVFRLNLSPGNRCNGWQCGLKAGDRVRVSVDADRRAKRPHSSEIEYYYADTLRIERCDDETPIGL